jgi:hypothetical protein
MIKDVTTISSSNSDSVWSHSLLSMSVCIGSSLLVQSLLFFHMIKSYVIWFVGEHHIAAQLVREESSLDSNDT